jgi:hypothetical protein
MVKGWKEIGEQEKYSGKSSNRKFICITFCHAAVVSDFLAMCVE